MHNFSRKAFAGKTRICRHDGDQLSTLSHWFAAVALHKIGAVMIPATHMLTVKDLVYRIEASKIKALVCTTMDDVPANVKKALKEAGYEAKLAKPKQLVVKKILYKFLY